MVKHIVMWRLDPAHKHTAGMQIKQALESLQGQIDGLRHIEVGLNNDELVGQKAHWADVVLLSELDDWAALAHYQQHPLHQAIVPLVQTHAIERRVLDFEV